MEYTFPTKSQTIHQTMMGMAHYWAQGQSYGIRGKIGCLITTPEGGIISQGHNGTISGFDNRCELLYEDATYDAHVLHAEYNAIAKVSKSTQSTDGAYMYCTLSPCVACAKLIIASGIDTVIIDEMYRLSDGVDLLIISKVKVARINQKGELVYLDWKDHSFFNCCDIAGLPVTPREFDRNISQLLINMYYEYSQKRTAQSYMHNENTFVISNEKGIMSVCASDRVYHHVAGIVTETQEVDGKKYDVFKFRCFEGMSDQYKPLQYMGNQYTHYIDFRKVVNIFYQFDYTPIHYLNLTEVERKKQIEKDTINRALKPSFTK